jgi:hypothetical protein
MQLIRQPQNQQHAFIQQILQSVIQSRLMMCGSGGLNLRPTQLATSTSVPFPTGREVLLRED